LDVFDGISGIRLDIPVYVDALFLIVEADWQWSIPESTILRSLSLIYPDLETIAINVPEG
jgi:hypothetical protein